MGKTGDIVKGIYDAFAKGDVPAVPGTSSMAEIRSSSKGDIGER